jgi:hypothetical protein
MALHGFALSKVARCSLLAAALAASPLHAAVSDFDNDGKSDIFWRHAVTGQNYLYPMNGLQVLASEGYVRTVASADWQVSGVGDFNGDSRADTLWRNSATGENYVYLMNGKQVLAEGYIRTVPSQSWQVAGVGDFNADGRADILWRNGQTGENYLYMMNGLTISSEGYVRTVADPQWKVAGVGDFNEDGRADILWRHALTGQNYLYPMNGLVVGAGEAYLRSVGMDWQVAGLGDFDNDGMADIFWRNRITGENYLFPMNGALIKATEGYVRTVADQGWQVAAIGNYDGAGGADVFWRHAKSGEGYMFFMSGTSVQNEGYSRVVAQAWRPVGGEFALQAGASPACASTGPSAGLAPALTASRTSGVAPLAVFFDASGTTGVTNAFHNVEYRWNFGDPGAGRWSTGARPGVNSRNETTGPAAAHVFEAPGTYKVCMTAFDGVRRAARAVTITVQDPDVVFAGNKTTCFSNDSDFSGCPAGATKTTLSSLSTALQSAGSGAQPRRLLFHRGDTFTIGGSSARLTAQGPGIVGAFGAGAPPVFQGAGGGTGIIQVGSSGITNLTDWRLMDVTLNSTGGSGDRGMHFGGGATRITLLRVNMRNTGIGLNMEAGYLTIEPSEGGAEHTFWDQIAVVDSDIRNMQDNAGMYVASRRFSLLGSTVRDIAVGTGHILRFPYLAKAVLNNNTLARSTSPEQTIKLHAPPWRFVTGNTTAGSRTVTNYSQNGEDVVFQRVVGPGIPPDTFVDSGTETTITMSKAATLTQTNVQLEVYGAEGGGYSEDIVISDNRIVGSATSSWTVTLAPQSTRERKEDLRNIVVERNWFNQTGSGTQVALLVDADNVTIRNNLCDMSGSSGGTCFMMARERNNVAHGPGATNVRVYHNTAFSSSGSMNVVELRESTVNNITVQNNLAHRSPSGGTNRMVDGSITGTLVTCASCNSTNAQITGTSPNFTATPPTSPAHYKPTGGYAIGAGIAVPVWSDFFLVPQPAVRDMGAVRH